MWAWRFGAFSNTIQALITNLPAHTVLFDHFFPWHRFPFQLTQPNRNIQKGWCWYCVSYAIITPVTAFGQVNTWLQQEDNTASPQGTANPANFRIPFPEFAKYFCLSFFHSNPVDNLQHAIFSSASHFSHHENQASINLSPDIILYGFLRVCGPYIRTGLFAGTLEVRSRMSQFWTLPVHYWGPPLAATANAIRTHDPRMHLSHGISWDELWCERSRT